MKVNIALLQSVMARMPLIAKTALLNVLRLSPTKGKQDLRTEVLVALIRSYLTLADSASRNQRRSLKDFGIKGKIWVSKVKFPRPNEDDGNDDHTVLGALFKAIDDLKVDDDLKYDVPELRDVEAEWTGYRRGVGADATLPDITEEDKYACLMEEVEKNVTILFFHGGAYWFVRSMKSKDCYDPLHSALTDWSQKNDIFNSLMDPCTHRPLALKLAKRTKGRCLSVRYRLAPQNPFPAALLDAFVAYLSLLSPPPNAFHQAIPANRIVLSGDSAGAGLSLALLQMLLCLRRSWGDKATIRFHGKDVPLELPAGVAAVSPWLDLTRSLPSVTRNSHFDYLPRPRYHEKTDNFDASFEPLQWPEDEIWPAKPPRIDFYAYASALTHPLVSPVSGPPEIWKGAPPILVTIAQDMVADDGLYFARKVARNEGSVVRLEEFEGLPHVFPLFIANTASAKKWLRDWAQFCVDVTRDYAIKQTSSIKITATTPANEKTQNAILVNHTGEKTRMVSLSSLGTLTDEEVQSKIDAGRQLQIIAEKDLINKCRITPKAKL